LIFIFSKKHQSFANRLLGFFLLAFVFEALTDLLPLDTIGNYSLSGYFTLPEVKLFLPLLFLHFVLTKVGKSQTYGPFLKINYVLSFGIIGITLVNLILFLVDRCFASMHPFAQGSLCSGFKPAVAEYIYEKIGARTLFATHFHQMNKMADKYEKVKNYNIAVKETKDSIIFLRKIIQGGTDKSYGVEVARLAGLPKEVIAKSMKIMNQLEMDDEIADRIHKPLKKEKEPDFEKKNNKKQEDKKDEKEDFTLSKYF